MIISEVQEKMIKTESAAIVPHSRFYSAVPIRATCCALSASL